DADFLAEHAEGLLDADEQKTVLWAKPARSVKSAKWAAADAVLIDEAIDLIERTHSLGHVVLDEAQDLSPMQYRAVGRRATTGSVGLVAAEGRCEELARALAEAGLGYLAPGEETTASARLTLVPASLAKGLEYDYVVLDEPAAVVAAEPDERTGLRRLYVSLTR